MDQGWIEDKLDHECQVLESFGRTDASEIRALLQVRDERFGKDFYSFEFGLNKPVRLMDYHVSTAVANYGDTFAKEVVVDGGFAAIRYVRKRGMGRVDQAITLRGRFQLDQELIDELVGGGSYESVEDLVGVNKYRIGSRWSWADDSNRGRHGADRRFTKKWWGSVVADYREAFLAGSPRIHELIRVAVLRTAGEDVCRCCHGVIRHECQPNPLENEDVDWLEDGR